MFKNFSWEIRSCGRQGHATYRPTEDALAARLRTTTPWGDAWRCLRCGDYVLGEPRQAGPADEAPVILRGNALRDAFVLRILAVDKTVRGLLLGLASVGIFRFNGHQDAVTKALDTYLPLLAPLGQQLGVKIEDLNGVHLIQQALALPTTTVTLVAAGVGLCACLNVVEGVGLWLMKRWGEYVAVIATSLFLPLEIHELLVKVTAIRVGALVINLFLVAYLVVSKRLFGVRGGGKAHEAERHSTSLLEVEMAAAGQRLRKHGGGVTHPDAPGTEPPSHPGNHPGSVDAG